MKLKQPFHSIPGRGRSRGVALVITLAILVLVTALVISMFVSVTSERSDTAAAANQSDSKRLANMVVELVKSTITQATTDTDGSGKHTAWASQPGMIRTWTNTGAANRTFRLYSSGTIATLDPTGTAAITSDATDLATWKTTGSTSSYNALWCDLNAPALSSTGALVYPLVTPPSSLDPSYGVPSDTAGVGSNDQQANGVQGFAITPPSSYSGANPSTTNNPAPMPVKWLYVLQNGEFVSPAGSGSNAVVPDATGTNPIIARVAYWTDDETCKVNINTASEGSFWQYPRGTGSSFPPTSAASAPFFTSSQLACFQPGRNEFQRYPGHPATTCLSSVIQHGTTALTPDQIYSLVPRVQQGGSVGGTQWPDPSNIINLSNDVDRLYVSPDELLYGPSLSGPTRSPNPPPPSTPLTASDISTRSFFLTACSRAPETTLFETPRVSIWPTMTSSSKQDPFDKLLNFCATLKSGATYYFQREKALDPTWDWTALTRNQQLFGYLQNMTSTAIPGFGGNFASKFGVTDRDQILAEIFDYIRSGPNLMGAGFAVTQSLADYPNFQALSSSNSYSFTFPNSFTKDPNCVVPISISSVGSVSVSGTPKGFGNGISFIQQAGVAFFCEGMNLTGANGVPANGTSVPFGGPNSKISYTVRAAPLVQLFRPTQTWDNLRTGQWGTTTASYSGLWLSVSVQGTPTITPMAGTTGTITAGSQSIAFPNNDPIPVAGYMQGSPIYSPGRFYNWESQKVINYYPSCYAKTTASGNFFESGNTVTITYNNPMTSSTASFFNADPTWFDSSTWSVTNSSGAGAPNATAVYDTSNPITDISGSSNSLWMHFSGMTMTVNLLASATGPVLHTATVTIPAGDYPVPHWNFNQISSSGAVTSALMYYNGGSGGPVNGNASTAQQTFNWIKNNFRNRLIYNSAVPTVLTGYDFNGWLGVDGDVVLTEELKANSGYNADLRLSSIRGLTTTDVELAAPGFREPKKHFYAIPGSGGSIMRNSTCGNLLAGNAGSNSPFEEYWDSLSTRTNGVLMDSAGGGGPGDWDNLSFDFTDGPFLNYPDTGVTMNPSNGGNDPYPYANYMGFLGWSGTANASQFVAAYSPNRQMYSPFQFGSLPARVWAGDPWETLLFCPNPAAGRTKHRGYKQSPKDYLLGDLFWMPIVDPYPISEPLSTAGKINLNYAIAPFNYITRKTGLWAALKASRVTAIPTTFPDGSSYYKYPYTPAAKTTSYVYPIDIAETLKGMDNYVAANGMFKSPTEIAEIFLVPKGESYSSTPTWWNNYQFTGDNTREQPYAYLLPRLTTKSNTYTVHYRVQILKKMKNDQNQNQWVEARDAVVSEFRGNAIIERYIDPNDPAIPDFAGPSAPALATGINLANFYRWRTVQQKQFIP